MNKRFDQKCVLCEKGCFFYRPEGNRETALGIVFFKEACGKYGYTFHDCYPIAKDCEGFITEAEYTAKSNMNKLLKSKRK